MKLLSLPGDSMIALFPSFFNFELIRFQIKSFNRLITDFHLRTLFEIQFYCYLFCYFLNNNLNLNNLRLIFD